MAQAIPDNVMREVALRLKHYIDIERREEGFDLSQPRSYPGTFQVRDRGGVGTFHYCSIQDRYLQRYFHNPQVRKRLLKSGMVQQKMFDEMDACRRRYEASSCRPKSGKIGVSKRQIMKYDLKRESNLLVQSAAEVLMERFPSTSREPDERKEEIIESLKRDIGSQTNILTGQELEKEFEEDTLVSEGSTLTKCPMCLSVITPEDLSRNQSSASRLTSPRPSSSRYPSSRPWSSHYPSSSRPLSSRPVSSQTYAPVVTPQLSPSHASTPIPSLTSTPRSLCSSPVTKYRTPNLSCFPGTASPRAPSKTNNDKKVRISTCRRNNQTSQGAKIKPAAKNVSTITNAQKADVSTQTPVHESIQTDQSALQKMRKNYGKCSETTLLSPISPKGSKKLGGRELVTKDSDDDSSGSFWLSQSSFEQSAKSESQSQRSDEKGGSDKSKQSENSSLVVYSVTTVTETGKDSS